MTDFKQLLHLLSTSKVDFILVGGMAATVHGATRLTQDLDIVYSRSRANLERLAAALAPHQPYLRGAPPGLPFRWDSATLLARPGWLSLAGLESTPGDGVEPCWGLQPAL